MDNAGDHPFVVVSELRVPADGAATLEDAFAHRLGEVDGWPGFGRLEVWCDERNARTPDDDRYLMVSWWRSRDDFLTYMRSQSHDRSHARVPAGPAAPRPASLTRYRVIAR